VAVRLIIPSSFDRDVRVLKKHFPHVQADMKPLMQQLLDGETPGDQVAGVGYAVFKVHVKSSDNTCGKSGGFRVIYYLRTPECVYLISAYVKAQTDTVDKVGLRRLIREILQDAELDC
jgi:hypothetical protein